MNTQSDTENKFFRTSEEKPKESTCSTREETSKYNLDEYQELSSRTRNNKMQTQFLLIEGALGLTGEAGEVADLIKKNLFQGHDLDTKQLALELGDVLWYLAFLADSLGYSMQDIANLNIAKLKKRFPKGFSINDSIERKD